MVDRMTPMEDDIDVETIHRLISEPARRVVIYNVATNAETHELSTHQLADAIAEEKGESPDGWYATLRHRHLPKLEQEGVIDWDEETGHITEGKHLELLFDYLVEMEERI